MKTLNDYQIEDQAAMALAFIKYEDDDFENYMEDHEYDSLKEAKEMFALCQKAYQELVIVKGFSEQELKDML